MNLSLELERIASVATAGNYSQALSLIDELLCPHAHEDKVWATLAFIHGHQGDLEAAVADWTKAANLSEETHYVYMRGIDLFLLSRYRESISDFTRVIQLCDKYQSDYYRGSAYFFRADAYVRLEEFDNAKLDCEHVRDDMQTWTDKLRTKADILAECASRNGSHKGG